MARCLPWTLPIRYSKSDCGGSCCYYNSSFPFYSSERISGVVVSLDGQWISEAAAGMMVVVDLFPINIQVFDAAEELTSR